MLSNFTHSLRFQIITALLILLVLFTAAKTFTFYALKEQRNNQIILDLAAKLQLTEQYLASQAMHYRDYVPPDLPTYRQDVKLYYQALMGHIENFDMLCNAFMYRDFEPDLTGLSDVLHPRLDSDTRQAVSKLETTWKQYRENLMAALGSDSENPQLHAAADYVTQHRQQLEQAAKGLQDEIRHLTKTHTDRINLINWFALLTAVVVALAIILWFYRRVIIPLGLAEEGFRKVAQGDFGHQVRIDSNNEIAWMTDSFNHLSKRLYTIFRLIDHIQQGSDLDDTLRFVGEDFSRFLPLDWLGVLFLTENGTSLKLEKSFLNGLPDRTGRTNYPKKGTLLALAMLSGEPQRIPDMELTATQNPRYIFLRELVSKGMHDAIFLPFADQSPVPGVLVFASRSVNVYTPEHLELLTNIAHLVTHSFGRTVKLAEHARLAAIGEFASGIAHEIRTPLATISIALDYFTRKELPSAARKRAELASQEAARVARLLDDMLLYAKPLSLNMREVDLSAILEQLMETNKNLPAAKHQRFAYARETKRSLIYGDPDRLVQIFLNLARNACEAAPEGTTISWTLARVPGRDALSVTVHNEGTPVPADILSRLFDPFFTTKPSGTGLGLSIVKRMVNAHGGDIKMTSEETRGTLTVVTFPMDGGLQ